MHRALKSLLERAPRLTGAAAEVAQALGALGFAPLPAQTPDRGLSQLWLHDLGLAARCYRDPQVPDQIDSAWLAGVIDWGAFHAKDVLGRPGIDGRVHQGLDGRSYSPWQAFEGKGGEWSADDIWGSLRKALKGPARMLTPEALASMPGAPAARLRRDLWLRSADNQVWWDPAWWAQVPPAWRAVLAPNLLKPASAIAPGWVSEDTVASFMEREEQGQDPRWEYVRQWLRARAKLLEVRYPPTAAMAQIGRWCRMAAGQQPWEAPGPALEPWGLRQQHVAAWTWGMPGSGARLLWLAEHDQASAWRATLEGLAGAEWFRGVWSALTQATPISVAEQGLEALAQVGHRLSDRGLADLWRQALVQGLDSLAEEGLPIEAAKPAWRAAWKSWALEQMMQYQVAPTLGWVAWAEQMDWLRTSEDRAWAEAMDLRFKLPTAEPGLSRPRL